MLIRVGYDIAFDLSAPTPLVLKLFTHPTREGDLLEPDWLYTDPPLRVELFYDEFGNRCARLSAPAGPLRLWTRAIVRDSGRPDEICPTARQLPVEELPTEVLPFLLASRYCEVDLLNDRAWKLFGGVAPGWSRVQAVCDWVQAHLKFGYEHARPTKTALDALQERRGVCRDFQHLALTFCRCLNIPARYATGYLGDIAIPPLPYPMDFSAWFEVYLDGRWFVFDARHNTPRVGRVLMAVGRDATDAALTTSFGMAHLREFTVISDELPAEMARAA
jgi:transglutaminase-like putative cysteine protease